MKFSSLFFLISLCSFSQNSKIEYYTFTKNTIDTSGIKSYLIFNEFKSLFVWKSTRQSLTSTSKISEESENKIDFKKSYNDTIGTRVLNHYNDTILVLNEPLLEENYTVIDKKPRLNWKIQEELKIIEGIKCQKATTHFRGRDYIAWFSELLPMPSGPWKLGGLPGIIIEAYDSKREVNFLFKSYNGNYKGKEKIEIVYLEDDVFEIKDFVEKKDNAFQTMMEKTMSKLPRGTVVKNRKRNIRKGLETKFEWEEEEQRQN